jgi:RNA polymerase sigma-70 factor (ECF subfamily)
MAIGVFIPTMERTLAERAGAGDAAAFRQIYERHAQAVFRFLCDLCGNRVAAEECTQETFVRAHRGVKEVREADKLLPWLLGIARNVSLEARRRAKRDAPAPAEEAEARPHPAPSPEALLLVREADRIVARAMARLSEERRAALLMHADHGLAYGEIAAALGWSLAKVKVEIHRARLVLRAEVAKELGEEP